MSFTDSNTNQNWCIDREICMTPNIQKAHRSLLYLIFMGAFSVYVVHETAEWHVIMGVAYLLGALLVFGVDIRTIKVGSFEVEFSNQRDTSDTDEWQN